MVPSSILTSLFDVKVPPAKMNPDGVVTDRQAGKDGCVGGKGFRDGNGLVYSAIADYGIVTELG